MNSALIVYANHAIREALAQALGREGWEVTTAATGFEGLESIRKQPFDVVVSDVKTKGGGGEWLWREALAVRPELRGRFVLIGWEPLEPRAMALFNESGHFLLKPLSLDTLWTEMHSIAGKHAGVGEEA